MDRSGDPERSVSRRHGWKDSFNVCDWIALALSLAAVLAAFLIADRIYERVPHLEDEIAYVWEAKAMAGGSVTVPTPVLPKKFLIPFVVDFNGARFGKYPLGWPALLSIGIRLGLRTWVNPLLSGLAVWLTYRLGRRFLGGLGGVIAALLTVSSPFFLMISGSLLSHAMGLVLTLGFVLAWWDVVQPPKRRRAPWWIPAVTAGGTIGLLAVTRPFTAIGVSLPFLIQAVILFVRGAPGMRMRMIIVLVLGSLIGGLHLVWQAAATGDPFFNLYTLWWPYDRVGFGPGFGVSEGGHNLRLARINTLFSIYVGFHDLFGWAGLSWILLPFGLWSVRRDRRALLTGSVFLSLLLIYGAYWVGSWVFGPRYQFEGLFSLTILSAAGICWLAGWPHKPTDTYISKSGAGRLRPLIVTAVFTWLLAVNLSMYLPTRLNAMRDLYGISRSALAPFEAAGDLAPAVIIVHADHWTGYGALLDAEDPFLTTPFIFVWGVQGGIYEDLARHFPERDVYHYYPDEPGKFYTGPVR